MEVRFYEGQIRDDWEWTREFQSQDKNKEKIVVSGNIALLTDFWDVPVLRPGGSLTGGGGLLDCWEEDDDDNDGGGGGAWLRPWLLPPDVCFLWRELFLWGSSGAPPPSPWDGPLETPPDVCGLYGGGGGGAEEPPVGGLLEDRGFTLLGGAGPLPGVGGRGFSLL